MNFVLFLQASEGDREAERVWSTWSLVGCASTLSVGAC